MSFMFRDLMVTVLNDEVGETQRRRSVVCCALPTVHCGSLTCPLTSVIHRQTDIPSLPMLKRELQNALAQVESAEATARAQSQPKTVAETEFVEQQLTEALDEVRRLKATLPPA
ncbi:hypothetical protein [Streptomyces sp. Root1310]|uniref:hypothetical protein n=1 Tax=Streptomyces sp. Root1310 TaxID=1736452 RepID=UPI00070C6806|nr:hypothetical protein [Streptomyces sp. Root1310]KQX69458.1 hypothetical protein ASD48_40500 [Streptomyces sp. Root1310]